MQRPGSPDSVTPTKPPRNDGAGHDNSDAVTESEEQQERSIQKRKRAPRVLAIYKVVQRWVTGERSEQSDEDIERDIFENARRLMHLFGLRKLPGHKHLESDLYLWKKAGTRISRGVTYVLY